MPPSVLTITSFDRSWLPLELIMSYTILHRFWYTDQIMFENSSYPICTALNAPLRVTQWKFVSMFGIAYRMNVHYPSMLWSNASRQSRFNVLGGPWATRLMGPPWERVSWVGAVAPDFRLIFSRQIRISRLYPAFCAGPYRPLYTGTRLAITNRQAQHTQIKAEHYVSFWRMEMFVFVDTETNSACYLFS